MASCRPRPARTCAKPSPVCHHYCCYCYTTTAKRCRRRHRLLPTTASAAAATLGALCVCSFFSRCVWSETNANTAASQRIRDGACPCQWALALVGRGQHVSVPMGCRSHWSVALLQLLQTMLVDMTYMMCDMCTMIYHISYVICHIPVPTGSRSHWFLRTETGAYDLVNPMGSRSHWLGGR